jgi:hypothetical protein
VVPQTTHYPQMNKMIKNRIGFSFPGILVFIGFLFMFFSIFIIIESLVFGLIILAAGALFGLSSYGSEIDVADQKFREYGSLFGIKRGKWEDCDKMPFIGVFKSRSGYLIYGRSTNSTTDIHDYYDVCLMNASHRRRIVLQKFKTKDEALNFAHMLETKINSKLTEFNPQKVMKH